MYIHNTVVTNYPLLCVCVCVCLCLYMAEIKYSTCTCNWYQALLSPKTLIRGYIINGTEQPRRYLENTDWDSGSSEHTYVGPSDSWNAHSLKCEIVYNLNIWTDSSHLRPKAQLMSKVWHTDTSYIQNYSCLSIRQSVRCGRSAETIWPQDIRDRISGCWVMEARTRRYLSTAVMALATGTNTSFLDRLYKKGDSVYLHVVACS